MFRVFLTDSLMLSPLKTFIKVFLVLFKCVSVFLYSALATVSVLIHLCLTLLTCDQAATLAGIY